MRMSPPISGTLWRERPIGDKGSKRPLIVDGQEVAAGTWVGVNMYAIHHKEEYFPNAFEFRPGRWIDEVESRTGCSIRQTVREAFSPFGVGSRSCAGKVMAYMEASLTIAKTLWYFDFERPTNADLENLVGGNHEGLRGRRYINEFQIYDQFIADHSGPLLVLKPRARAFEDLE